MKTYYCILWVLVCLAGPLYCLNMPENYLLKTDSLFNISDEKPKTFVGSFKDENKNTIYYSSTTKILEYCVDTLEKYLIDVKRYPEYFQFITKSELIRDHNDEATKDVYFSVAKGGFAKALFIGSIDSVASGANGHRKIYYSKNHDSVLNRRYFEKEKGLFKVEFHEFNMFFNIKKIGWNKSNVCLVSIVSPKIWIPNWLFRMTAYFLFPSILSDFEKFLQKECKRSNVGPSGLKRGNK